MKHISAMRSHSCYSEYRPFHLGLPYSDVIPFLHESLRQLPGLTEENVVNFDGFADNLAKKNDSLIHYLLSNPAYELIVQLFL